MHGFKSFAEPAVIEFHEGVTCIVGPNGSGKSNISDAIRWVLGEQSPKMLRGGKMEEVIFAGTANRKSRGMAEVTLVIDNSTGILPIDYNEVAITRRMYRSGESEYLINNNQCRLRDIRELIMDTGIGVDGYSIIGQGKIADIVGSKPESRREIFEEAAGVVMYKSKKAESERKLSSATANLERVNDIIGEIESRIDSLRDDSIKAEEYIRLRDRYKELEINMTLKSIERLDAANKTVKDDIQMLGETVNKLGEEKKSLEDALAKGREKNQTLEQLGSEAKDKLLTIIEEINRLTNKSQLDAQRLETIERDLARIQEEAVVLDEKKQRELGNAEEISLQKTALEKSIEEADTKLVAKIEKYNEVNSRLAQLLADIDDNKNKMYALYNEETSKRSEARSMESYKESLNQRKQQILSEKEAIKENRAVTEASLVRFKTQKSEAEAKLAKAQAQIEEQKNELEKLTDRSRQLSKESSRLQIQISQTNARKKTIEEMEANYEGYNGAVRFIMKSNLRGLEGVAADLMTVPAGLEVAVETALGAAMQNVVCTRDDDAKAAVKALKDSRAGRLTFLPVESVKGSRASLPSEIANAAGCSGIAADLVKYDAKYEGIFRYLLGRVVIVDSMKDAIAFSKKIGAGIRFVTLEGEVVNASGAITGGKYKNASANLLERKGEIQKLADSADVLTATYRESLANAQKNDDALAFTRTELAKCEETFKALQLETFNLQAKIETVTSMAADITANDARQEQQLASIDKDYDSAESMAQKLCEEAAECRVKGEEAQNQIARLMEEQETVKIQADEASDEITAARIEKNKWDSDRENLEQMLARVIGAAEDFDFQLSAKNAEADSLKQEKNKIMFGSGDAEETVKTKTDEKVSLEEYIGRVSEERTALAVQLEEMSIRQGAAADKFNACRDQKYQEEIKLAKNETQLDTLKEKLWDEFEISYLQAVEFRKEDFAMSTAQKESREIKSRLKELGDVNVGAIEEYAQVRERYEFLTEQRGDITSAMQQLKAIIDDMEKTIKTKFKENFDKVVINFEAIFKSLFGGGHAELRLDDEDNPLEAGIEIIAQPPGKKLQNINLMSGGEKTMTAIALMFAVLKTTPTPFCILDEVEAALDDSNIERFAKYLKNFNEIQFAIVTHQKATMEHADVLYGVTMPEQGISKVLSLRLGDDFSL